METLSTFFSELTDIEGVSSAKLVSPWKDSDVNAITKAFDSVFARAPISLVVKSSTTLPALGNRVAKACVQGFNRHLTRYKLRRCGGQGYPDSRLEYLKDGRSFAFEIKAKAIFNPADSNRVVLTSGTRKLRRTFGTRKPICHLLATVLYTKQRKGSNCRILLNGMRLDFLEPWSPVQKRYESSVSQRLLSRGKHKSRLLGSRVARS